MRFIITEDYEVLSKKAAGIIAAQALQKNDSTLGLATGDSAVGIYKNLIKLYNDGFLDFSKVKTVNLDEYIGMDMNNKQSYAYYMKNNLFKNVNIDMANTYIPNGLVDDLNLECKSYENHIANLGGIDLQLLGIGSNGHIGFNEPSETFKMHTHVVELDERTIKDNSRFFNNIQEVPRKSISMGIGTIMKAKKILLVASGKNKAEALLNAFYGEITPKVPASILQLHHDVTVIADKEAEKLISEKISK